MQDGFFPFSVFKVSLTQHYLFPETTSLSRAQVHTHTSHLETPGPYSLCDSWLGLHSPGPSDNPVSPEMEFIFLHARDLSMLPLEQGEERATWGAQLISSVSDVYFRLQHHCSDRVQDSRHACFLPFLQCTPYFSSTLMTNLSKCPFCPFPKKFQIYFGGIITLVICFLQQVCDHTASFPSWFGPSLFYLKALCFHVTLLFTEPTSTISSLERRIFTTDRESRVTPKKIAGQVCAEGLEKHHSK